MNPAPANIYRVKSTDASVEEVIKRLTLLARKMRTIYEVVGEEGIEQVYDSIKEMIDYLIEVNRALERCKRKHGGDYASLVTKVDLARQLARALYEIRSNCPACDGKCKHNEEETPLIRQVDTMIGEAWRAKLLNVDME